MQMHMFTRNYVKLLKQEAPFEYGQHLIMNKAYFATSTKGECLFVEPMIDCANSEFDKYANNNGLCLANDDDDDDDDERRTIQEKAESFVHYSYVLCAITIHEYIRENFHTCVPH